MRVTPNCDPLDSAFYVYTDGPVPAQFGPDITFGGGNYFVIWGDGRSSNYPFYGARVTPAGSVLDPSGIQITRSTTQTYNNFASVTWGGTRYFVVWGNYSPSPYYVYGRFVNTDGTMASDTIRLAVGSEPIYCVDVAYDGTNFLVIWHESGTTFALKGIMVSSSGVPIGSAFTIASPVHNRTCSRVVFDGTNYLVTYTDYTSPHKRWGRKYNLSGAPVGSAFRITPTTNNVFYGDVVPGANNRYLNVWEEFLNLQFDIRGNIDHLIIGIEETAQNDMRKVHIPSIIKEQIAIPEFAGKMLHLYDACGRNIASTKTGYFDCSGLKNGVYFIRVPDGDVYKVVKIE